METGHRFFFAQLDVEAVAKGARLDDAIRRARLEYVKASARIDEVGSGVLLVQDEAMLLNQARTNLVSLLAVQHTLDEQKILGVAGAVIRDVQPDRSVAGSEGGFAGPAASPPSARLGVHRPVSGCPSGQTQATQTRLRRARRSGPAGAAASYESPDQMTRRSFLDWLLVGCGAVPGRR